MNDIELLKEVNKTIIQINKGQDKEQVQGQMDLLAMRIVREDGNPTLPCIFILRNHAKNNGYNITQLDEVLAYGETYWSEEL